MRFVLASNNAHKLEEFRAILSGSGVTVLRYDVEQPGIGVPQLGQNAGWN